MEEIFLIPEEERFVSESEVFVTPPEEYEDFFTTLVGEYRIQNNSASGWLIYIGVDGPPDFEAEPAAFVTSLPAQIDYALGDYDLYVVPRKRDSYGCVSQNQYPNILKLTLSGPIKDDIAEPQDVFVYPRHDAKMRVLAQYPTFEVEEDPADKLGVWVDLDPEIDPPTSLTTITNNHPGVDFGEFLPGTYTVRIAFKRSSDSRLSPIVERTLVMPEIPGEPDAVYIGHILDD